MKKIIALLLVVLTCLTLVACGSNKDKDTDNKDGNTNQSSTIENESNIEPSGITLSDVKNAKETNPSLFKYEDVDGGIIITGFTGDEKIIAIPDSIDGKKVVSIGRLAFANNTTVEGLRINSSTVDIGENSFENCFSLKIVVTGKNTKTIKEFAFNGCKVLDEVELNEGLESMAMLSFGGCKLNEIIIPDTVTTIDMPFTKNETSALTIIGSSGGAAENYVSQDGESFNLVFKAK